MGGSLGVWIPTSQGVGALPNVMLQPAVDVDYALTPAFRLRTRQGARLGLASDDRFTWASAYGASIGFNDVLVLEVEVALVVGVDRALDTLLTHVAPGVAISGRVGPVTLSLGARYNVPNDGEPLGQLNVLAGAALHIGP